MEVLFLLRLKELAVAALLALICFVLAMFGVKFDAVNIVYLGFAFLALGLLIGNWPIGVFARRE
jgi:hypothetical protein